MQDRFIPRILMFFFVVLKSSPSNLLSYMEPIHIAVVFFLTLNFNPEIFSKRSEICKRVVQHFEYYCDVDSDSIVKNFDLLVIWEGN